MRQITALLALALLVVLTVTLSGCGGGSQPAPTANSAADEAFAGNGKIVFSATQGKDYGDVFKVLPNGTGLMRLTTSPGLDFDPTWSPDGTKIAFVSNRTGYEEIWVMNANGTGQTKLTNLSSTITRAPAWSLDGLKIAFAKMFSICTINANGTGFAQLSPAGPADDAPAWSPDSLKIVFSRHADVSQPYNLWVMNANGTGATKVTTSPWMDSDPAWSPDTNWIAFTRSVDSGDNSDIYKVHPNGTGVTPVTNTAAPRREIHPSWKPAGGYLTYGVYLNVAPKASLYTRNLSTNAETLVISKRQAADPVWWTP